MTEAKISQILSLIKTIGEAIDYKKTTPMESIDKDIKDGRDCVTALLEEELKKSLEDQINISSLSDDEWVFTANNILVEMIKPFKPQNGCDLEFMNIINDLRTKSENELVEELIEKYKSKDDEAHSMFEEYLVKFPLWGTLNSDSGDWTSFVNRIRVLKRHSYDFLWLYRRLGDYTSKKTLISIMINWKSFDTDMPLKVVSMFEAYFEPDLFVNSKNEVFADVGAYIGDTVASYISFYGIDYKKIYTYEIAEDSCKAIEDMVENYGLHDVIVRRKGVSSQNGVMYVSKNTSDASANQLSENGQEEVELVCLDEDAPDVTFIKMDIEGAEKEALKGCRNIIAEKHPKLAICIYHGYEDIIKIPLMINNIYPEYKFFMRHYGGNLLPTEFVLYCKV